MGCGSSSPASGPAAGAGALATGNDPPPAAASKPAAPAPALVALDVGLGPGEAPAPEQVAAAEVPGVGGIPARSPPEAARAGGATGASDEAASSPSPAEPAVGAAAAPAGAGQASAAIAASAAAVDGVPSPTTAAPAPALAWRRLGEWRLSIPEPGPTPEKDGAFVVLGGPSSGGLCDRVDAWFPHASLPNVLAKFGHELPAVPDMPSEAGLVVTVHNYASFAHVSRGLQEVFPAGTGAVRWELPGSDLTRRCDAELLHRVGEAAELQGGSGDEEEEKKRREGFHRAVKALVFTRGGAPGTEAALVLAAVVCAPAGESDLGVAGGWCWSAGEVKVCMLAEPASRPDEKVAARFGLDMAEGSYLRTQDCFLADFEKNPALGDVLESVEVLLRKADPEAKSIPKQARQLVLRSAVSLEFLLKLRDQVAEWYPGATTRQVAMHFIKPYTEESGCRYFEQMRPEDVGCPVLFISQMQDARFLGTVDAVIEYMANADRKRTFVWMDIFAINQHAKFTAGGTDLDYLDACLLAAKSGTLMVLNPHVGDVSLPLSRAWCVLEVWSTVRLRGPRFMAFHGKDALPRERWEGVVRDLDLRECQAFSAADKDMIIARVEAKEGEGGVVRVNRDVKALLALEPLFFAPDMQHLQEGEGQVDLGPVLRWMGERKSADECRVLWLQGGAGSGKSTVSTALVERAAVWREGDGEAFPVVLHHFTKHNDAAKQDPVRAVRTLGYQLHAAFPGELGEHFEGVTPSKLLEAEKDLQEASRLLLARPLEILAQVEPPAGGSRRRVVLLVDALDEGLSMAQAEAFKGSDVPKCHENGVLRLIALTLSRLPGADVIVTSRLPDEGGGAEAYLAHMMGERGAAAGGGEVRVMFVEDCRREEDLDARLRAVMPGDGGGEVLAGLHEAARGSMVYFRLYLEAMARRRAPGGGGEPSPPLAPPPTLPAAYRAYLGDSPPAGDLMRVLRAIAAAREPLSQALLRELLGLEHDARELLQAAGMLFRVGEDFKVYPFHKSAMDFLAGEGAGEAGAWRVDRALGHRELAAALVELHGRGRAAASSIAWDYCMRSLVYHAREAAAAGAGAGAGAGAEAAGWALERLAGDLGFWTECYAAGHGARAVLDLLGAPARVLSEGSAAGDARRFLQARGAEFAGCDPREVRGRVMLRAYDAPEASRIGQSARAGLVAGASGRMIAGMRPASWGAQVAALRGHERDVMSVAFSPDGRVVASGSNDSTVRLWDAATGAPVGEPLRGHEREVMSVAFSPDGRVVASGSDDMTVRLWDAATGAPVGEPLRGHKGWVMSVAFSPDGRVVASGSDDMTVRLWDAATGAPVGEPLRGHERMVRSVAFSPDGRVVASGSWDETVRLWDAATGALLGEPLRGHEGRVNSVAFSPDGRVVASGSFDKTVRLWDAATGAPVGEPLRGHEGGVMSVAFSPDGRVMASGSWDETVRLWDAATGALLGEPLRGHEGRVNSVAFSPVGRVVASGSFDKTVRLWDAATGAPVGEPLRGHERGVMSVAFSPDGRVVASGSDDMTVRLWDAATGALLGEPLRGHEGRVNSVAFSPDGRVVASGSEDKTVRLWDAATGALLGEPLRGHEGRVNSVAFSPDGRVVASGSFDKTVRLWDAATGAPVGEPLRGHGRGVMSVGQAFSPDGRVVASGSDDMTVRLWDAATGAPVGEPLRGHENWVSSVAFSPDGRVVASGSFDKTVRLWDAATGAPVGEPLRGHEREVMSVAFSPDGRVVASGSDDMTVRLWDAATGAPVGEPLRGHEREVMSVAFSPDGRVVASGSWDKTVRLWDAATGALLGEPLRGHERGSYRLSVLKSTPLSRSEVDSQDPPPPAAALSA